MQFIKKIKLTFLGLVLSLLLPIVSIIVIFMAVQNYNLVYDIILKGFNTKLLAISTSTSAFIDGDEHEEIARAKEMTSFSYDHKNDVLYAFSLHTVPQRIDKEKGAGIRLEGFDIKKLQAYTIYDIAINSEEALLYATTNSKEILALDLKTKEISVIKKLPFIAEGIAYQSHTFYLASENSLYRMEKDEKIIFLQKYQKSIHTLSLLDNNLYTVNKESNSIASIDIDSLVYADDIAQTLSLEEGNISHLSVSKDYFYTGKHHLIMYERNSSKIIQEDFARFYRNENASSYLKYIAPMSDIKTALNLSCHYTFKLIYGESEHNCFYVLDVQEGREYTPIGSYHSMQSKDLIGAENVMLRNDTYISDIKLWEKWGLLKVAYTGIKDKNGKTVAVVGADVDISIIQSKTKKSLINFTVIALLALIIAMLASYFIAIRIIRPIKILKSSALKIASGNYRDNVLIKSPKELSALSLIFNEMSQELQMSLEKSKNISTEEKSYLQGDKLTILFQSKHFSIQIKGLAESKHLVGVVENERYIYIYSIEEIFPSALEATKRKLMLNHILERFLEQDALIKFFSLFVPSGFIILDKSQLDKIIIVKKVKDSETLSKKILTNKNKVFTIKNIEFFIPSSEDKTCT
jgi:HAMP domain-containing protein